jgi:hydroxyacylglutathione hydrolase
MTASRSTDADRTNSEQTLLQGVVLGPFATNCYLYAPSAAPGSPCWIIDAGLDPGALIDAVRASGLRPEKLILTHAHLDHMAGVDEVSAAFEGLELLVHEAEREWLTNPDLNLSGGYGVPMTCREADRLLHDDDELTIGDETWRVLHTPGHSPGGITLYNADRGVAFVGDTLFAGSIGRHDFPGSDFDTLARSIRTRLYSLPDETVALPGHGPETLIGREKRSNPFVRAEE